MPTKTNETRDALSAYYQARSGSGQPVEIADVAPLEGGKQHEMYSFNLVEGKGTKAHIQPSVLRLYDGTTAGENAEYEYKIMEKLGPSDVPVPEVFVLEQDAKYLGRPFIVMEKVEGEELGSFVDRIVQADPLKWGSKEGIVWNSKLAALLASIHEVEWRAFGLDFLEPPWGATDSIIDLLDSADAEYMTSRYGELQQLFNWLRTEAKEAANPEVVLMHYDFHPWNVMVRRGKIVAVLDWCEACLGDAAFDVGWANLLFHLRNAAGDTDVFVAKYKRHSGRELKDLAFYEVAAGLRRLSDLLIIREGKDLNRPPEAAALFDVSLETAKTASFIYQRTGIDVSSI